MSVKYSIKQVETKEAAQVAEFMKSIRKELFPMLNHNQLPADLVHVHTYYLGRNDSALFAAISEEGEVLGTIGYLPYDNRFEYLQDYYAQIQTTELVRCYIDPGYRRLGIGSALYKTALKSICAAGYEKIYLHTHPFLPGGVPFWKALGFEEKLAEPDPIWKTLHMDKKL
ncbi:GNAT family N-acetyltransferase [Oceanobacillus sp. FSL W8-0428]|uniref:GNAT family N-acetyltransferase n=1 Tax=Oceanobacillus TaxID=182709 RepID=UPI000B00783E